MFLIDPTALLFASLVVGLVTTGIVALAHLATPADQGGLRSWVAADLAFAGGRLLLLLQPGVLHSTGLSWLTPERTATLNGALVLVGASLHTLALWQALNDAPVPRRRLALPLSLPLAYLLAAPYLPADAMRLQLLLAGAIVCMLSTLGIVWPHRRQYRGAWLICGTMGFFLAPAALAIVGLGLAPPGPAVQQHLPRLPALLLDMASALAMSMGFMLLLFERMGQRIDQLSATDPLTGANNRRGFMRQMELLWALARRQRTPLALAMLDLDHFKRINDTLGHDQGDAVLTGFVQRVQSCTRSSDVLGRWGGEEFVLLMPCTTQQQALMVTERLRAAVAASPLAEGAPVVTVSVGVTSLADHAMELSPDGLLQQADACLYSAKQQRNCVVVDFQPQPA